MTYKTDVSIQVNSVSFHYEETFGGGRTLKDLVIKKIQNRDNSIHRKCDQIEDISFTVSIGEQLGLIGRNGAGKSTLLRLIAGIILPDSGKITVDGTIAPLISIGSGINPEFSVIENVYLTLLYQGYPRSRAKTMIQEIVSNAGLEDKQFQPVRTLSVGQLARLTFFSATNRDNDILLLDEITSVGDYEFQAKTRNHLQNFLSKGKVVVLVSHDLDFIEKNTQRCLWIEGGKIMEDDLSHKVIRNYRKSMK